MVHNNSIITVKLFGPSECIQVRKCVAVASIAQVRFGHSDLVSGEDRKSYFKALSPLSIYPALKTAHGNVIGSNAICDFLAASNPLARLIGNDIYERGVILGLVETCSNTLEVFLHNKVFKAGSMGDSVDCQIDRYLIYLSEILEHKTFLVGERRSYADVAIAVVVKEAGQQAGIVLPGPVTRWLNTIYSDPAICKADSTTSPTSKAEAPVNFISGTTTTATVNTEAPATGPIYKYTAYDMGHPDLKAIDPATHLKVPNQPIDLSEGSINLEDWKRTFSNAKTPEDYDAAFKIFWEQFNPNEYTLWKMVYDKYEGEGVVEYLTVNLMNGFVQASGAPVARKTSFGVIVGCGVPGDYNYSAVYLMRGTEMLQWMVEHRSFEYHNFAKIDSSKVEMRQMIEEFWTSEVTLFGKPIIQRVEFK